MLAVLSQTLQPAQSNRNSSQLWNFSAEKFLTFRHVFGTTHHRTTFSPLAQCILIFTYIEANRVTAPQTSYWINMPKLFWFLYISARHLFCTFPCLPYVATTRMARCDKQSCQPLLPAPHPGPSALPIPHSEPSGQEMRQQSREPPWARSNIHDRVLEQGGNAAQR